MGSMIQTILLMAPPIIFAVVFHEVSHGYVAWLKGDNTAKVMGRLTLNPIAHVHWFGTIVMPLVFYMLSGFLFAFAKPVPVNFGQLRDPKKDMIWVASAGPFSNIVLAIFSALSLKLVAWINPESYVIALMNLQQRTIGFAGGFFVPVVYVLYFSVVINIVLAIINLIPIPPADGGRIVSGLLPDAQARSYSAIEPYGLAILIFILFYNPLNIINWTIHPLINGILNLLL